MSDIAIIDIGAGNLYSVEKAVRHVVPEGFTVRLCSDAAGVAAATHIILPGVGAFADCMRGLHERSGLREALEEQVLQQKKAFLGICVGMQMLLQRGHEHGIHEGLGWFAGEVQPLQPLENLKIPHMGWNELQIAKPHPLLAGVENGDHAYFVHSFHCNVEDDSVVATVDYGGAVTAAIARDNIFATQFHPEKSQKTGLRILRNFIEQAP